MDVADGELERDKLLFTQDILRKRLFDLGKARVEGGGLETVHHLAGDACILEFLRARIHPCKGADSGMDLARRRGIVHLRVDDVHPASENLRLAEENENASGSQPVPIPFDALEKDHLHLSSAVCYNYAQAFDGIEAQGLGAGLVLRTVVDLRACLAALDEYRASGAVESGPYHPGHHLHVRDVGSDLGYTLDAAPVYVTERIQVYKVLERRNLQLIFQQHCTLWSHPRQVLDIRLQLCHVLAQIYAFLPNSSSPFLSFTSILSHLCEFWAKSRTDWLILLDRCGFWPISRTD